MARQYAANHAGLGLVGRVEQHGDFGLGAGAKEGLRGLVAEARRDDYGDGGFAFADRLSGWFQGGGGDEQSGVLLHRRQQLFRDWPLLLIDEQYLQPGGLLFCLVAPEDIPKEAPDQDGSGEGHDHGAGIAEEDLQVLADEGEKGGHASRRLRPVR